MTPGTPASEAEAEAPRKSTVDDLGQGHHRDIFTRALANVLSTPAAETTFAQILDGAPLSACVEEVPGWVYPLDHPVRTQHRELCPGVLDRTRHSRGTFDVLQALKFDSRVCWRRKKDSSSKPTLNLGRRAPPGARADDADLLSCFASTKPRRQARGPSIPA